MDGDIVSDSGSDMRFHDKIVPGSPSKVEAYHHLMHENRQLIYEIKIGVISVIGSIIIVVCLMYIIVQCKKRSSKMYQKFVRNRRPLDDRKNAGHHDSTESLLKTKTTVRISSKSEMEYFV